MTQLLIIQNFISIMKKTRFTVASLLLSGCILCSSCIGSFGLWNKLKDWNEGIGNKFVNEIVFVAMNIIPVYGVCYLADLLVLNSIEFWSGSNPMAEVGSVKIIEGENGEYLVRTNENGYTITKKGEKASLDLVYNQQTQTWNAVSEEGSYELMTMNEDGTITVKMGNGNTVTVTPDIQGLAQVHAASQNTVLGLN